MLVAYALRLNEYYNRWLTPSYKIKNYTCEPEVSHEGYGFADVGLNKTLILIIALSVSVVSAPSGESSLHLTFWFPLLSGGNQNVRYAQ